MNFLEKTLRDWKVTLLPMAARKPGLQRQRQSSCVLLAGGARDLAGCCSPQKRRAAMQKRQERQVNKYATGKEHGRLTS